MTYIDQCRPGWRGSEAGRSPYRGHRSSLGNAPRLASRKPTPAWPDSDSRTQTLDGRTCAIKQLASSGSVTDKSVDETQSQLSSAEASRDEAATAVQSAEAAVRESLALTAKAKADAASSEARLAVAKSDLDRAETMLGYTVIAAPYDGVITERTIDTGHFVQPASGTAKPLLEIARTDKVRVSRSRFPRWKPDSPITATWSPCRFRRCPKRRSPGCSNRPNQLVSGCR